MSMLALAATWLTLAQSSSLVESPTAAVVATTKSAAAVITPYLRAPEAQRVRNVNFARRSVVAAFVRLPTPCNRAVITGWSRRAGTLTVHVEIREPQPGTMCAQVIASGYHVLSVPKLTAPARVRLRVER